MKTINDKIERVIELKNEISVIRSDFQTEMFEFVREEFLKRGFIVDPRGKGYERSLYSPEIGFSVRLNKITELSVSISVIKMIDGGMVSHSKAGNVNDGPVLFNFTKKSFDIFFISDFKRNYTKQNNLLETTPTINKIGNYTIIS